jgi:hypothetical protein
MRAYSLPSFVPGFQRELRFPAASPAAAFRALPNYMVTQGSECLMKQIDHLYGKTEGAQNPKKESY